MEAVESESDRPGVDEPKGAPSRKPWRLSRFLNKYAVVGALILVLVLFSVILPQTFFTLGNFRTILSSQAVLLIVALGLTVPLAAGEFDLSFGATLGFAEILTAHLSSQLHINIAVSVLIVLLVGVVIGLVNGLFVVRFGVNSFIVTLGTSTVLAGLTLAVSGGQIIQLTSVSLQAVSSWSPLTIPIEVYVAFLVAVLLWYVFQHTPTGRYLFFVGEGRDVARLAGLRVNRIRWVTFLATSILSTIAGLLAVGQLGAADPSVGGTYLLPAFAAAFLGATTIQPGRFNAWGTVVATYLLISGVTGLELLGASSWAEQVFNGGALVVAVTLARLAVREGDDS